MSNGALTPLPNALVLDTSFLRTVGGTESAAYQTFSEHIESEEIELLLGSTPHDSVDIVMDDRNAERAIAGVITNTYYEGCVRMINIWDAIAFMES